MHWNVPLLPKGFYAVAIPPIAIKVSVAESEMLQPKATIMGSIMTAELVQKHEPRLKR